jgi:SAM-dependent methyltransferase
MDAATFAIEAAVEESHWWFVGRRLLFAREIGALGLRRDPRILDIGTSTGTNLRMLRNLGYRCVVGLDLSEEAVGYCEAKGLGPVRRGDVCALPFEDASFDLVLATDIIEHVADDGLALREIARVLASEGKLLLTVPAFASLWGLQDEVARHRRRYRMRPLLRAMASAGLVPLRRYHFNYLLFAPIWLTRRIIGFLGIRLGSEAELNTTLLNRVLSAIFRFDLATAPHFHPPFGVSILVVARKRGADDAS